MGLRALTPCRALGSVRWAGGQRHSAVGHCSRSVAPCPWPARGQCICRGARSSRMTLGPPWHTGSLVGPAAAVQTSPVEHTAAQLGLSGLWQASALPPGLGWPALHRSGPVVDHVRCARGPAGCASALTHLVPERMCIVLLWDFGRVLSAASRCLLRGFSLQAGVLDGCWVQRVAACCVDLRLI